MSPGLKSFNKKSFIFRYFMAHFVDNDSGRERSGRKRRVDPFKESHGYGLRANDSSKLPEFEIFLKWLKSSCLTPVPVKTLQQVLEDPRELAVIQERVATLSSEDEETLRKLHSLDDFPETWKGGVLLSNSVETPSRVRAGVKPPGAVCVPAELSEREIVSERLGETVLVEKSSFRGFHVDVAEEGHSFSTLVTGRKIWMFCLPSPTAKKLDAAARDRRKSFSETINLLQGLSRTQARQVSWTLLEPGCTVYFLYLFLHSVWTDVQPESVCTMYSCERTVEEGWRTEQMRRADQYLALGCRRGEEFGSSS